MSNRIRLTKPLPARFTTAARTYWNGERAAARKVRLRLVDPGLDAHPNYWARELTGLIRAAVRVEYGGQVLYLDDAAGYGWAKVTEGRGSPKVAHRALYGDEVTDHSDHNEGA